MAILILALAAWQLFRIRQIDCRLNNQACSVEVSSKLDFLLGQSLFFNNLDRQLANKIPQYQLTKLQKKLPSRLVLELQAQEIATPARIENFANQTTQTQTWLSKVHQLLEENQISYITIMINPDHSASISLSQGRTAIVDQTNTDNQIYKLKVLLNNFDFQSLDKPIKTIDLRFKLVVLRNE